MSQDYTPGPWTITRYEDEPETYVYFQAPDWLNFAQAVVRMEDDAEDSPTGLANARLIAAAPDMLEALQPLAAMGDASVRKAILAALRPHERDSFITATDNARAAIAKATGGQP